MPSVSRSFPPAPQSVGRARQFAARTLAAWGASQLEDDVRVVVSELATNALLHARTEFTLGITLDGDTLRLTLADGSSLQPRLRRFDSTESTTGRGLRMVADLTQTWGIERDGAGKAVWCEFSVASTSTSTSARAGRTAHAPDVVDVDAEVETLLALYGDDGDDDDGAARPHLSSCGRKRPRLVGRVVA